MRRGAALKPGDAYEGQGSRIASARHLDWSKSVRLRPPLVRRPCKTRLPSSTWFSNAHTFLKVSQHLAALRFLKL
jgi:hypothetical protein